MVQSALRQVPMAETPRPHSLTERLEAELAAMAVTEPTVSSMAERFAPGASQTKETPRRPLAADANLASRPQKARRFALPSRGVVVVLTAVALAPAAILAGLLWIGAIRGTDGAFDFVMQQASPKQQAAVIAVPALPSPAASKALEIALTAPEEIVAKGGEVVPFAIAIDTADALPERSVIAIRDLPKGATFSEGRPYGDNEWSLLPEEIAGLSMYLPETESGASDLRVELVSADGAVLARAATSLDIAPNQAPLVTRPGEADRVTDLIAHGNKMIAVGYFAGARAYFERAADAGSGEAALAVGATYDPGFIAKLGVQGIKPDPQAASAWYERATALGVIDRTLALAALESEWTQGDEPPVETAIMPPEEAAPAAVQPPQAKLADEDKPGPIGRLMAAATELTSGDEWLKTVSAVNMRADASSTSETRKIVQKGLRVRVMSRKGNWVQVTDPATDDEGWIYARFLEPD